MSAPRHNQESLPSMSQPRHIIRRLSCTISDHGISPPLDRGLSSAGCLREFPSPNFLAGKTFPTASSICQPTVTRVLATYQALRPVQVHKAIDFRMSHSVIKALSLPVIAYMNKPDIALSLTSSISSVQFRPSCVSSQIVTKRHLLSLSSLLVHPHYWAHYHLVTLV